jgi:hypothetical protein
MYDFERTITSFRCLSVIFLYPMFEVGLSSAQSIFFRSAVSGRQIPDSVNLKPASAPAPLRVDHSIANLSSLHAASNPIESYG